MHRCPACHEDAAEFTWNVLGDVFPCPHCGVVLEWDHECSWDGEEEHEYVWLIRCSDPPATAPTPPPATG